MNPKARQILYSIGTIATGVLTLLVIFHIIDAGTAANLTSVIGALGGLFGTAAVGTAAVMTQKQINNGTLTAHGTPVERAVGGLQDVAAQYNDLVNQVTSGVQQVHQTATALTNLLPAPISGAINEVDSLAAAAMRAALHPGQV
jgi:hypothetical protein